jgi:hypothetical protein
VFPLTWNPPGSWPTLYLNGDVATARMQVQRLTTGAPYTMDDPDDDAYLLVAATLPAGQTCADAVTAAGLRGLGLPETYPLDDAGQEVSHDCCQAFGEHLTRSMDLDSGSTPVGSPGNGSVRS